jgi:hypothetical protein
MNTLPLHVIIKQLANTSWSKLPEATLRSIHTQLQNTIMTTTLKTLTIPKYVPSNISGKFSDLEITYEWEDVGLLKPILQIDEVFLEGVNLTELLSKKALEDIASKAEALLQREEEASEILAKVGE